MAVTRTQGAGSMEIDKIWLQQQFADADARTGFVPDATVTLDALHAQMLAEGVRPQDNAFSREILRERYPEDAEGAA